MSKDIAGLLARTVAIDAAPTTEAPRRLTTYVRSVGNLFAKAEDDARQIIEALPRLSLRGMCEIARHLDGPTLLALLEQVDDEAKVHIQALMPKAELGEKFAKGRKHGTVGPVRKAIAKYLKAHGPDVKNPEIWDALFADPPRALSFFDNRCGQYVEWKTGEGTITSTSRKQFETICGEERKKL